MYQALIHRQYLLVVDTFIVCFDLFIGFVCCLKMTNDFIRWRFLQHGRLTVIMTKWLRVAEWEREEAKWKQRERERWVELNGGIGCTQSVRYQLNYCMLGLLAVAMGTSQQRDGCPGEFLDVFWENCQMTSLPAVTVVTALTSDKSHKWSCCCLQVDGQPSRLQCTPFSDASVRHFHFLFSVHTARSPFQEQGTVHFVCVKYLCHAFGLFQFTQCIGFSIFNSMYNANSTSGRKECINLKNCTEFFQGCKDWENISLSMDKYLD